MGAGDFLVRVGFHVEESIRLIHLYRVDPDLVQ